MYRGMRYRPRRMYGYHRPRRGGIDPYLILLAFQLLQQVMEMPNKPPVTLGLAGLLALLHFKPGALMKLLDLEVLRGFPIYIHILRFMYEYLYIGELEEL